MNEGNSYHFRYCTFCKNAQKHLENVLFGGLRQGKACHLATACTLGIFFSKSHFQLQKSEAGRYSPIKGGWDESLDTVVLGSVAQCCAYMIPNTERTALSFVYRIQLNVAFKALSGLGPDFLSRDCFSCCDSDWTLK